MVHDVRETAALNDRVWSSEDNMRRRISSDAAAFLPANEGMAISAIICGQSPAAY